MNTKVNLTKDDDYIDSIDYQFYENRAHRLRAEAFTSFSAIKKLLCLLKNKRYGLSLDFPVSIESRQEAMQARQLRPCH